MSLEKVNIQPASDDVLKTLDLVLVIDHSGSMEAESKRMQGKTRYDEVQEQAILAARKMSQWDDDGITLIHFATAVKVSDGVTADAVANVFKENPPGGSTNLHLALQKVGDKARITKKDVACIVFTDGEANDTAAVLNTMNALGKEFGRPKIGFCFVQVGNDQGAAAFLDKIDNELKIDISAHFSEEEAEALTIAQLIGAARSE